MAGPLYLAGPNILTITWDGFGNASHTDNDKAAQAFGMWWTARRDVVGSQRQTANPKRRPRLVNRTETVSHAEVEGGGFFLPARDLGLSLAMQ
jgi:hypothetical protein